MIKSKGSSSSNANSNSSQATNLQSVLSIFVNKIQDIKVMNLSTLDGIELITVSSDVSEFSEDDLKTVAYFAQSYYNSTEQVNKLGIGKSQHSMTWIDNSIIIQNKINLLTITLACKESSNLGLIEEYFDILDRILQPFNSLSNNI